MDVWTLSEVSDRVRKTLVNKCQVEDILEKLMLQLHALQENEDKANFSLRI